MKPGRTEVIYYKSGHRSSQKGEVGRRWRKGEIFQEKDLVGQLFQKMATAGSSLIGRMFPRMKQILSIRIQVWLL